MISFADDVQYLIKAGWKFAVRIAGFQPVLSLNRMSRGFGMLKHSRSGRGRHEQEEQAHHG
jgi:hypothetical protein